MSPQVEKLLTALTTIALGIVGVAFIVAIVSNKSQSPQVLGALSSGFACSLAAAMGQGNKCGGPLTSVKSTFSTGCVNVGGVSYCP